MPSTTISLDRSAYDLLRSRKLAEESFSEEIHRLLGPHAPELKEFLHLFSPSDAADIADSIEAAQAEDLEHELEQAGSRRRQRGRRA